jgi:hypothetical protein
MNMMRACRLLGVSALLVVAGCAASGHHPCFAERVMYEDRSTACQYGRTYQCDNGDWIAARRACNTAPQVLAPAGTCEFDGIAFASGAASCNDGRQYRCDNGRWSSLGRICAASMTPYQLSPAGSACNYNGAAVANSSAICQSGTTYLCNNGQWVNLGTVCG